MELSATTRPAHAGGQLAGAGTADLGTDLIAHPGATDSVVVHVQLRPRRPAVRRCLAALVALAAEHPSVAFELTGLSKDDRVVRVTVGIDLGPRAEVAKFSASAQAAYVFVDGLFTSLYDYMPVYVAEPGAAERDAAVGVLDAIAAPRPFIPAPRRSGSAVPAGSAAPVARPAVPALI